MGSFVSLAAFPAQTLEKEETLVFAFSLRLLMSFAATLTNTNFIISSKISFLLRSDEVYVRLEVDFAVPVLKIHAMYILLREILHSLPINCSKGSQ